MTRPGASTGLRADGVRARLGGTVVVDGVDVTVPPGGVCAVIGPNGAGKSTLLRVLAGVLPAEGRVLFGGQPLSHMPRRARARLVALVEQEAHTELDLTVREVVALGRIPHQAAWQGDSDDDRQVVDASLDAVGVGRFADRRFAALSGGERQRVLIARALAQQPRLLLLDEPTNHLDVAAGLDTMSLLGRLAASGLTVVAVLHDLNLALAGSDQVVVMQHGRVLAAGATADTLTADLVQAVYGVRAAVLTNPLTGRPVVAFDGVTPAPL